MGKQHCGGDDCNLDPYAEERCNCSCLRCSERALEPAASSPYSISESQVAYLQSLVRDLLSARERLTKTMIAAGCDGDKLADPNSSDFADEIERFVAAGNFDRITRELDDVGATQQLLERVVIDTFRR